VESDGKGLAGVRVSDGRDVVLTDAEGAYALTAESDSRFVWISVPDGYKIPVSENGTARFYEQIPRDGSEAQISFQLSTTEPAESHAFLLLADPQTQDDYEMKRFHAETVPDILGSLSGLSATETFGVSCGDIMYHDLSLYPDYEDAVRKTGIPFFQVVGNHDLDQLSTDEASVTTFTSHFGPAHYSFDRGEVHYIVLDDVFWLGNGYVGYIADNQMRWLERDLQTVEEGRTVVVFTHIPLLSSQFRRLGQRSPGRGVSVGNREEVYRLLEPFNAHILTGHTHEQEHIFEGGVHEHVHGTVCGAWWSGNICFDGTPNGYSVYEVHGSDVRWRYKATGMPADHQIRTYAAGADPAAPDEIVANIWDWDPEWSVGWYENGERRGMMSRRTGTDPLAEELHRGPELPSHRPWVEPMANDHMFYCPAAGEGSKITIEAVDRWGNTYVSGVPGRS
jgi:hypothetical protein